MTPKRTVAKFCAKWRAEQLPVYFLMPNGEDFVFGLLGVFEVFVTDAAGGGTFFGIWPGPTPIAPRDKTSRKGKPLAPIRLGGGGSSQLQRSPPKCPRA